MKKCFFLFNKGNLYYSSCGELSSVRALLSFGCTVGQMKRVTVVGVKEWDGKGNWHTYTNGLELEVIGRDGLRESVMHFTAPSAAEKACWIRAIRTHTNRAELKHSATVLDAATIETGDQINSRTSVLQFREARFIDIKEQCAEHFKHSKAAKKAAKALAKRIAEKQQHSKDVEEATDSIAEVAPIRASGTGSIFKRTSFADVTRQAAYQGKSKDVIAANRAAAAHGSTGGASVAGGSVLAQVLNAEAQKKKDLEEQQPHSSNNKPRMSEGAHVQKSGWYQDQFASELNEISAAATEQP